ncbi:alpha/beta hydrolase [Micromonospora chersina]|uniref:alpha/beta hydrolase n=1 Tax=Micromonospora chersina TaxID=47854 RepID=UPI003D8E63FD
MHIHGTWGNFYENAFIHALATVYSENGYSFATVNVPGHDYESVHEHLDDFYPAINEWLKVLNANEAPLILQGHSLGAVKIASVMTKEGLPPNTAGVVLLAPFDTVAFNSRGTDGDVSALHRRLDELITEGVDLVPSDLFEYWPISVKTLRALTTVGGPWDQFPTRLGQAGAALTDVALPTLIAVGGNDFASTPDPASAVPALAVSPKATGVVVPNAPHNFAGEEQRLCELVAGWLKESSLA